MGHRVDPPPEQAGSDADHERLTAAAEAWATAIVSNDAERMAGFMADDWVIVSASGISTKEQFLAFVASGELTHSAMEFVSPPRIRLHGDTAVFTARATNTAHYGGRRFDAEEWTTDVFVRREGGWLCVLSHITAAAPAAPPEASPAPPATPPAPGAS
ncbi:nuclear transport factor 2 family protein [Streptomyces sp. NPDC058646]|uniref:nuclear transport factor 2 family protein n=1 Tax=Streptomyces sp. NPDC058646 TaxID=3346574 RepID=UPI00364BEA4A